MKLTGKQKRYLRARANRLRAIFEVGKNGLSNVWLTEIERAIESRELIKISILQNATVTTEDVKTFIEKNSDINVVQQLGRTLVLFKQATEENHRDISLEVNSL